MDLNAAVNTHVAWRMKLRSAIARKERLDAGAVGSADRCELGKWIAGDGRARWGTLPELAALAARHEEFHRVAAVVAASVNAGEFQKAEKLLGDAEYTRASTEVTKAIIALQQRGA